VIRKWPSAADTVSKIDRLAFLDALSRCWTFQQRLFCFPVINNRMAAGKCKSELQSIQLMGRNLPFRQQRN
jgi:hypothetical protein